MYGLETVGFKWIAAALLPDIDMSGLECKSLVIVEATTNHGQLALSDSMEDNLSVVDIAYAHVSAGRWLHPRGVYHGIQAGGDADCSDGH